MMVPYKAISIVRMSDKAIYDLLMGIFQEIGLTVENSNFRHDGTQIDKDRFLKIAEDYTFIFTEFLFIIKEDSSGSRVVVNAERNNENYIDNVTIGTASGNPVTVVKDKMMEFVVALSKSPKVVQPSRLLSTFLGDENNLYLQAREAEIERLTNASRSIIVDQQDFLKERERQYSELFDKVRRDFEEKDGKLELQFAERKSKLDEEALAKKRQLEEYEEELNKKAEELRDGEARHERRKIREDIKKELKVRSEVFKLTSGTMRNRWAVHGLCIMLLMVFGGLFWNKMSSLPSVLDLFHYLSLGGLAFAFSGTAIYYLKWQNSWFQQLAQEELRLKRMELDIDRASWVAEMMVEMEREFHEGFYETEVAKNLFDRLTANMFTDSQRPETVHHPVDQLASALLGSAANVKLRLPGGSEIDLDKKGIKDMSEQKAQAGR
ncbi:MAG: hypothetical protein HQL51_03340 [Magnetococcales bacterium]|nr:hypothetical protein [Magnetococcales bacterium]